MVGSEQVLIEDWCQQYPSHSIGSLAFGADGALYVSGGDGASFNFADYGQDGAPLNPCGDPPGGVGGAHGATDRRGRRAAEPGPEDTADPVGLDGSILRVDPATGRRAARQPAGLEQPIANARRIVGYGLRNPFRITTRPGTNEVWIGDVGWNDWEEIDRVASPTAAPVDNFGWPCYEGDGRQGGIRRGEPRASARTSTRPGAARSSAPYFRYHHNEQRRAERGLPEGRLVDRRHLVRVLERWLLSGRVPRRAVLRRLHPTVHLGDADRAPTDCPTSEARTRSSAAPRNPSTSRSALAAICSTSTSAGTIRRIRYFDAEPAADGGGHAPTRRTARAR